MQVPTGLRQPKTLPTPLDLFPGLSGALHGARANAGFDVPLDYSVCLDDVSGILQVDAALPSRCVGRRDEFHETERLHAVSECFIASASVAETERLHMVSENLVAYASVAETDRLHTVSENLVASAVEPESDRLLAVSENLAVPGVSGGHSAWRSRVGGLRLRRQAQSRSGNFVVDSSSSSHHVDHVHNRSVGCAHGEHVLHGARTNSCLDTHAVRVNSFGLHSARGNSGGHINSYWCTYNSCGGVRGGTKPMSMSTRCQVGCPASLQQAPGRLHVETWAGRDGNPSLPIFQVVEILPGCADMVTRLPLLSSLPCHLGRAEVRNGMGWSLMEKTARSGVWLFRGALSGSSAFFCSCCICKFGCRRDRSLRRERSSLYLRFLVHTCIGEARLSGHNLESGAGHCLIDCGGLSLF